MAMDAVLPNGVAGENARIECTHADDAQTEALQSTCDVAQKQTSRFDESSPFDRLWFALSDEREPQNAPQPQRRFSTLLRR